MFTARWPHELKVGVDRPLRGTYPTLAEFLASHGYATAGFVANTYFCNSWYGLGRGFAHYEDYYESNVIVSPAEALRCAALGRWLIRQFGPACNVRPEATHAAKNADRVNRDFLAWIAARPDRPFFAFLNYMDAHDPYITPAGFDRHFGLKPESAADREMLRNWDQLRKAGVSQRDVTLVSDAYDDCLAYLDQELGRLFDRLERDGVLHNTLVILTADHGEEIGEHGLYGHGKSLYRREVQVPLLVFGPRDIPRGRIVEEPVSLRDIPATVVERLGLLGDSPFPGCSLAHRWEGEPAKASGAGSVVLSEVAVKSKVSRSAARAPALRGPMASLIRDGKVYIRDALGREELYDLAADPGEERNLAGDATAREVLDDCRLSLKQLVPDATVRR
jgi:arylsulfatase A-like enzyme